VKRFCLVRHGQTDWNLEGRFQGQSDVPLNQTGRNEAHALAEQLISENLAAIVSSDLMRSKETAEIIAEVLHLPISLEPRLREINQGEWEGLSVEVIKTRYYDVWEKRSVDPANFRPPGGESVAEVAKRVQTAMIDNVRLQPTGCALIVSHGLALATIICLVNNIPIGNAYNQIPENTKPIWVNFNIDNNWN
jgi:broad specificity phosphatase PhoE